MRVIPVAILDMNAGMANLGTQSLRAMVDEAAAMTGVEIDVTVHDVRRSGVVPSASAADLFLGTGGPGHIDPRKNDGVAAWSMGIVDDPAWEAPLFRLFEDIRADDGRALFAVCHTFGLLCHWSGVARSVERPDGRRLGVQTCVATADGRAHPALGALFPEDGRLIVVENRQFNLLPDRPVPAGMAVLARETRTDGAADEPVTMVEFARASDGWPRMLGVNFHPEIKDAARRDAVIGAQLAAGAITHDEAAAKRAILAAMDEDPGIAAGIQRTHELALLAPVTHWLAMRR